jgi:hypothetical protein
VVEPVTGNPPWLPLAVYDDGNKTVMHFKESLRSTNAPAVFVRNADGSSGVVEFTPYAVPDAPEMGAYYLIQGLWPQAVAVATGGKALGHLPVWQGRVLYLALEDGERRAQQRLQEQVELAEAYDVDLSARRHGAPHSRHIAEWCHASHGRHGRHNGYLCDPGARCTPRNHDAAGAPPRGALCHRSPGDRLS